MRLPCVLAFGCLISCASKAPEKPVTLPPTSAAPRYEQIWGIATHNSYWVDRGNPDALASGVSERMLDQLLGDGARGVEIDIHKDRDNPHRFAVYHTNPGNSLCDTLSDCLGLLRAYHDALPAHSPTLVVLELKEIAEHNFDDAHTIEDLDAELRAGLGESLYSPGDIFLRCDGLGVITSDLSTCVDKARWPDIDALRGKFVVGVLGNWDAVAPTTADWVDYAKSGVAARAAFPMVSTWKLDYASLPDIIQSIVTPQDLAIAETQSVLAQVEDTSDARLADFVQHGAVVRIDGAASLDDQATRLSLGAQLLQTDTPWVAYQAAGIVQPLHSLRADVSPDLLQEPGERLALTGIDAAHIVFAGRARPASSQTRWEATIVSGHDASRIGCLRAESAGSPRASISVCRRRHDSPMQPDNQLLDYDLVVCDAGACHQETIAMPDQRFGERVAIDVASMESGASCVTVSAASDLTLATDSVEDSTVTYSTLSAPVCVNAPLVRQGFEISGSGTGPALFFRSRLTEDSASARGLRATDFDNVVSESTDLTSSEPDIVAINQLQDWTI